METITLPLTRQNRPMLIAFPPNMSGPERKKAVSELFKLIRSLRGQE
jgi:hypothetical protein